MALNYINKLLEVILVFSFDLIANKGVFIVDKIFKTSIKSIVSERVWLSLKKFYWRNNMPELAMLYGTDKWGLHRYASHYQRHFCHLRNKKFNLLEIGVGGHDAPDKGGASLRMWKAFFPHANIYAIDIFDKSALEESRIRIFRGSQANPDFLRCVVGQIGQIDVVIDDGSHVNEHVISSFKTLFPLLSGNGIYAIEDLQTACWPEFGGSNEPDSPHTSMGMLKRIVDGLNWEEFHNREPEQFDKQISSISFYHNLAFIYKGINIEGTNKIVKQIVHA